MESTLCLHCGQPAGALEDPRFCCIGCQAVYRILKSSPFAEYYAIRENGVCFTNPSPVRTDARDYAFWNASEANPLEIYIEGIHCTACVWLLERLSLALPEDVSSSSLDLGRNLLAVTLLKGADRARIARTIESFGYRPILIGEEAEGRGLLERENRARLVEIGVAGALAGNVMLMSIPLYSGVEGGYRSLFEWISLMLAIPSVFYCGRSFFKNVAGGLRNRVFPIDGPILLAILAAFFYSVRSLAEGTHDLYFDSVTALVFLLLSSRYYLSRVRQSNGIQSGLTGIFHPPYAGAVGDEASLEPGCVLAFDGRILKGCVWIDQSHFTGEARPVRVGPGDPVYAGSSVVDAEPEARVRVEITGAATRLEKFLKSVAQARSRRTRFELSIERWARHLLVVVLGVAGAAALVFLHAGFGVAGFNRILALLIVTCPCALAFATPLVYSLAANRLLEAGLLIKNPEALDRALKVKNLYFDKTGTLTHGALRIDPAGLAALSSGERSRLGSLAFRSVHPVSRAIYRGIRANFKDFIEQPVSDYCETPGVGIEGVAGGILCGLRKSFGPGSCGVQFYRANPDGSVAVSDLHFEDGLREDTGRVLEALHGEGFVLGLLSGDHEENAKRILGRLPVRIRGGLGPAEKAVDAADGMMVGDGVNDALALSKARIGFAVQGGMEAAIDSSDVYSLRPGISGVPVFFGMARRVRKVLILNFGISTAYNAAGAVLALTGYMSPLLAAVLMPLSATTVFLNSSLMMRTGMIRKETLP